MQITNNVSIAPKNFSSTVPTPPLAQKIGDWALKLATAAIIIGGVISTPPLGMVVLGGQIIAYAGVAGTLIKSLSKLFGVTPVEPNV